MRTLTFNHIIGSGSMGTVYRAELRVPGGFRRPCAAKVIRVQGPDREHFVSRMRDEARLLGMLQDEQILGVTELVLVEGHDAVIMEAIVSAARNELLRWDQARALMRQRLDELDELIEREEAESHAMDARRDDLRAKLKTVIAPREAEALQNQIRTLEQRRSELDDAELAALEEQARLDGQLTAHLGQEAALRAALVSADAALGVAEADIDGELTRIADRLDGLRSAVGAPVLKRYDRLREQHVVAAASLAGSRCEGCHLDLSAAEVDDVRDAAATGGLAECPQCGRLLVI